MAISERVRKVGSSYGCGESRRRANGILENQSTKPVVVLAYPRGLDDVNLKEQLSSLFNPQILNPDSDARTTVGAKNELIDLRPLKDFAKSHLRSSSSLYEVLFAEPDELETSAFLAKVGIWLRLLRRGDG
jgi:hypothetical protein